VVCFEDDQISFRYDIQEVPFKSVTKLLVEPYLAFNLWNRGGSYVVALAKMCKKSSLSCDEYLDERIRVTKEMLRIAQGCFKLFSS
jgi:hypothetical protein